MITPIGTWLTRMDAAITGSIDGVIAAMTSSMATPVALAAIAYYGVQGLKLANGDASPLQNFVPQLIRVGVVIWLSSNLDAFNYWVRDIFFTGLPNALASAIGNGTGVAANGLTGAAAIFDNIWNQIWVVVGTSWSLSGGLTVTGMIAGVSGFLTGLVCGVGLILMAIVYVCARMVLAVVVCLAPVLIGCAMFDVTRPIFERAVGKVVSLILLQSLALIVLQILLLGDQWFMAQATTMMLASVSSGAIFYEAMQVLVSLAVWFFAGAVAMYNLPAVAYSIGGGVMMSSPNLISWALLARSGGGNTSGSADAPFNGSSSPPLSLSVNRPEVSGSDASPSLPPPPPPSISHSTRR